MRCIRRRPKLRDHLQDIAEQIFPDDEMGIPLFVTGTVVFAVGTSIAGRPPGHRRRSLAYFQSTRQQRAYGRRKVEFLGFLYGYFKHVRRALFRILEGRTRCRGGPRAKQAIDARDKAEPSQSLFGLNAIDHRPHPASTFSCRRASLCRGPRHLPRQPRRRQD
jgi:hypothetical protein